MTNEKHLEGCGNYCVRYCPVSDAKSAAHGKEVMEKMEKGLFKSRTEPLSPMDVAGERAYRISVLFNEKYRGRGVSIGKELDAAEEDYIEKYFINGEWTDG